MTQADEFGLLQAWRISELGGDREVLIFWRGMGEIEKRTPGDVQGGSKNVLVKSPLLWHQNCAFDRGLRGGKNKETAAPNRKSRDVQGSRGSVADCDIAGLALS